MESGGTGSIVVDVILVMVALTALSVGYRQGGVSSFLSLLGVLFGGFLGVTVLPHAMAYLGKQESDSQGLRVLVALVIVAGAVVIGYAIGSGIGAKLRDMIPTRGMLKVDSIFGAIIQVVTAMIVVWLILVPAASNNSTGVGTALSQSRGLHALNKVMPGWVRNLPSKTSALVNSSDFPVIMDPLDRAPKSEVGAPDAALKNSPVAQKSQDSVVKVVGHAQQCQRLLQGSGFVVAPNTIMTNAHVVAGTDSVDLQTTQGVVKAKVTYYNPATDIALLKTSNFAAKPLPWSDHVAEHGENVIVLGYPMGGDYTASPARVRDHFVVSGPNIYANQRVEREAYSLRGTVVQGNSGGPLLDETGKVLGLVFGADMNETDTGYALTKEEVLKHVQELGQWNVPVETGACVLN